MPWSRRDKGIALGFSLAEDSREPVTFEDKGLRRHQNGEGGGDTRWSLFIALFEGVRRKPICPILMFRSIFVFLLHVLGLRTFVPRTLSSETMLRGLVRETGHGERKF